MFVKIVVASICVYIIYCIGLIETECIQSKFLILSLRLNG
jgi:hypothetical protein